MKNSVRICSLHQPVNARVVFDQQISLNKIGFINRRREQMNSTEVILPLLNLSSLILIVFRLNKCVKRHKYLISFSNQDAFLQYVNLWLIPEFWVELDNRTILSKHSRNEHRNIRNWSGIRKMMFVVQA